MFRPQEISATEARKYFSQLINKVRFSSKSFVIKSYRKPTVRIVKEDYIAILEQVLGKKTVGQILHISGNDSLFEATKKKEIKKILQRRLSGPPRQQPKPQPQPQQKPRPKDDRPLAEKPRPPQQKQKPQTPKPPQSKQSAEPRSNLPAGGSGTPPKNSNSKKSTRVLLLSNGKNYQ